MKISDLNSLKFWLINSPFDFDPEGEEPLILCDHPETFNTEDKDGTVKDFKPYYHRVHKDDENFIDILVDTPANDHVLIGFNSDGTVWKTFDFVQVGATNHFTCSILPADWAERIGQKVFFAVWETDNADVKLIHAVTDLINVRNTINKSVVLTYQHVVEYDSAHKDSMFSLRIPASFIIPNYPEENESEKFSTGDVIQLSGQVDSQTELFILPVPGYIIQMVKTALKCSTITIKNKSWKQIQPVEMEKVADHFEYFYGKTLLHQQGATKSNVYVTP